MRERTDLLASIRAEVVGPSLSNDDSAKVVFADRLLLDDSPNRRGPAVWQTPEGVYEEVLYYDRESPHRKYGAGVLHTESNGDVTPVSPLIDPLGAEPDTEIDEA